MGITLEQAREAVGRSVVYTTNAMRTGRTAYRPEDGTIERVGAEYVHVRYSATKIAATRPEDLDFPAPIDAEEQADRMLDAREALRSMGGL